MKYKIEQVIYMLTSSDVSLFVGRINTKSWCVAGPVMYLCIIITGRINTKLLLVLWADGLLMGSFHPGLSWGWGAGIVPSNQTDYNCNSATLW